MSTLSLDVGSFPSEEPCENLPEGWNQRKLAKEYARMLKDVFPPPEKCDLFVRMNPHDFGAYPSVVAEAEEGADEAAFWKWALTCEGEAPQTWLDGFGPPKTKEVLSFTCAQCGDSLYLVAPEDSPYGEASEPDWRPSKGRGDVFIVSLHDDDDDAHDIDGKTYCGDCVSTCAQCGNDCITDDSFSTTVNSYYEPDVLCGEECLSRFEYDIIQEAAPGLMRDFVRDSVDSDCIEKDEVLDFFEAFSPKFMESLYEKIDWYCDHEGPSIENKGDFFDIFPKPPAFVEYEKRGVDFKPIAGTEVIVSSKPYALWVEFFNELYALTEKPDTPKTERKVGRNIMRAFTDAVGAK